MSYKIIEIDPYLAPFEKDIDLRMNAYKEKRSLLLKKGESLSDFANAHHYFGFHRTKGGWVYREWAPGADSVYLTGDFCDWHPRMHKMEKLSDYGVYEIKLKGKNALKEGQKVQTVIIRNDQELRRIPLYATRVVQDPKTNLWCAEIEDTMAPYPWTDEGFSPAKHPLIYECHIGMASEEYKVASYKEFKENILPRIKDLGYNTIQIMAIMEHPYYGSFGYQVSNFFAASSRYGKSEDLKDLINTAHSMGIAVLLDVVHSHAVKNTAEGINEFDGTTYQFFHDGPKGDHSAWGTKLFNYGKDQVIHFLLSNLKFWMETFHFDGFRFDGVTSMLYLDHGLGSAFTGYEMYFSMNTDIEAITYLQLANELIHSINKNAITIAEDMSGMPGMCLPIRHGGIGFDFRLSMGLPDLWIKLIKEYPDEAWDMFMLWYELTGKRPKEKTIGYAESHDQALVGDKTIMFRLCDAEMYWNMAKDRQSAVIDRGMALHKMIRLITSTLAGDGYLNFMGNEFGHPEWIDFPREGNGWSYHHCRRQWSLSTDPLLRYEYLLEFDKAMIGLIKKENLMKKEAYSLWIGQGDKVMMYGKGNVIFTFNFNPTESFEGYFVPVHEEGTYAAILSTDEERFGGACRADMKYKYKATKGADGRIGFMCYLPQRCATVFKKISSKI